MSKLQRPDPEILRTHTYRTMPLPAEFLNSQAAKGWAVAVVWLPGQIKHWRARLERLAQPED